MMSWRWDGMAWHGMGWDDMAWHGMLWHGADMVGGVRWQGKGRDWPGSRENELCLLHLRQAAQHLLPRGGGRIHRKHTWTGPSHTLRAQLHASSCTPTLSLARGGKKAARVRARGMDGLPVMGSDRPVSAVQEHS